MKGGNFKIKSFNVGGVGLIVVERINQKYVRENAHFSSDNKIPKESEIVFYANDGLFLTSNGERVIVKKNI